MVTWPPTSQPEGEPSPEPEELEDQAEEQAEVVAGNTFGPWEIISERFLPFDGGISIIATCTDPQGNELEYSVSLQRGRGSYGEIIAQLDEPDWQLQNRLHVAVIEEVNSELRQLLIAKRFE